MASAALPARAEKCFWVATIQAQANTPTTIEGVPFITSATKRVSQVSRLAGILGAVDAGADADGQSDQAGDAHDEQGADDGVCDPAAGLAGGRGRVGEEVERQAPAPLATRSARMKKSGSSATTTARS